MPQKYYYDPDDNAGYISQHLTDDGTASGDDDCTGDYSSVAKDFYIQPAAGEVYVLQRMIGYIEDAGNFTTEKYGVMNALTNGLFLTVTDADDALLLSVSQNDPVKTNGQWAQRCYDVNVHAWGAGSEFLVFRWTFGKAGRPLILKNQQKLKLNMNDNMTGLVKHHFVIQGFRGHGLVGNK